MPSVRLLAAASLLVGQVFSAPSLRQRQHDTGEVESFIATQRPISLQGMLDNIGPDGAKSSGASAGVIIASPSTVDPNYLYTWTRDAGLTIRTIIDEFINGNAGLREYIDNYVRAQAVLQTVNNPSGSFYTGAGLGEPKYLINLERFNGNWGRPQRDGPALRAIALLEYVSWLMENGEESHAKDIVWPVIANDLTYTGQYWNQTGFDLWEEVRGSSFFTTQAQYRALAQGGLMAEQLGLECEACANEAPQVLCFLQSYWNGEYIVSNTNLQENTRTGLDANYLIGALSTFDIDATCDSPSYQPCNSQILASHKALVDSFRQIYAVNADRQDPGTAAAVGRYAEDVYYNGNPWYLTTLAAAETLYAAIGQWQKQGSITVDETSLGFFQDLIPEIATGDYTAGYPTASGSENNQVTFDSIIDAVHTYADGFVLVVREYTPADGAFAEQYTRENGTPISARDLTWSYASFVTTAQRRAGEFPPSWRSAHAAPIAQTCQGTSTNGTYVPATGAGAPDDPVGCTVGTTFNVNATTYFGENVWLVGNTSDTGNWDVANGLPLGAGAYTAERPLWSITVDLAAEQGLSYVYARQQSDGTTFLYESINRTLEAAACGRPSRTIEDAYT